MYWQNLTAFVNRDLRGVSITQIDGRFPAHASKLSTLPANSYLTGTNSSNQNSMAVCETPNLYNRDVEYTLIIEYTVNMSMTF